MARINPLSGFLYGLIGAESAVNAYEGEKEKQRRIKMQQEDSAPLTPSQLEKLNAGEIPEGLPRKQQIQLGENIMRTRATADKGMVTLNDADIKNYSDFKKQGWQSGQKVPVTHYNQVTKGPIGAKDLSPEQKSNLDWGMQNKLIAPKQLTYRGPKAEILSNSLGEMRAGKRPKQSLIALDALMAGEQAAATGEGRVIGAKGQEVGAMASSMEDTLKLIEPLINKFPDSKIQMVNKALREGAASIDDPDAQELLGYITSLKGFYASIIHGGGVPDVISETEASKRIHPGIGKKGFPGLKRYLINEGRIRTKNLQKSQKLNQTAPGAEDHDGTDTYTYPDGTRAKYINGKWEKIQ